MPYKIIDDIVVYGDPVDENALAQMRTCLRDEVAIRGVLAGDHHKCYNQPVGGIVAYHNAISVSGVGFDIGCGNRCSLLDIPVEEVKNNIKTIMDDIFSNIEFGIGRSNSVAVDQPLFYSDIWEHPAVANLYDKARKQLGTVGSGNHYVDIFSDELDRVWVGVHFGSRGLGHGIATWFLKEGGAKNGMDDLPCVLGTETSLGQEYIKCMRLAGEYAYAGRDWVCEEVARMLGANILETVHNHHNFAWKEKHYGRDLWVVRKGATPAFPEQLGFVGGSMGDNAVILEGIASAESALALYSTVHGAGRVMSRTQAAGKLDYKTKKRITEGAITYDMMQTWVKDFGVELRGAGTDEAPQAYKRLPDVLAAHIGTIKIKHTLKPLGVAMAGPEVYDPYKD